MPRPPDLPEYENPPIDEVIIGVQFAPLAGFSEVHVGLYWLAVRDRFPETESQPRLETPVEQLFATSSSIGGLLVPMIGSQSRTWLKGPADDLILQVQNDRFLHNWRRRGRDYPRFDELLVSFWREFGVFRSVLEENGLPTPAVRQVEVEYINWMPGLDPPDFFVPARSARSQIAGLEDKPEVQIGSRFTCREGDAPIARLYSQCIPAARQDGLSGGMTRGAQFTLVFRAPTEQGENGDARLDSLAEAGRSLIVRLFTEQTTPEAHKLWERTK